MSSNSLGFFSTRQTCKSDKIAYSVLYSTNFQDYMRMKEQKVIELILNSVFQSQFCTENTVCEYFDKVLSSLTEQSLLFYAERSI